MIGLLVGLLILAERRPGVPWTAPFGLAAATPAGGRLFARSLALAACASLIALLLAFPVGMFLGARGGRHVAALALVPVVIPPHVAAYVWRFVLEDLVALVPGVPALARTPWGAFAGAAWTLAALYWPLVALPLAVGMRLCGNRLREELATLAPPRAVFWRALAPGLAPALVAGLGVFFLLALANYGVPLMWNVPSQNIAVFARLAAYYSPRESLILAMPLAATAALACFVSLLWLARRPHGFEWTGAATASRAGARWLAFFTAVVLVVTVAVPLVALAVSPGTLAGSLGDFVAGLPPFVWGCVIAALGATGATALGLALAAVPRRAKRLSVAIEFIGLCSLFVPAAIVCLVLAGLMNGPRWLRGLYDSLAVFLVAYGLRFFYVPWKIARLAQSLRSPAQGELVALMGLGPLRRARLALAGTMKVAAAAAWLLVFALALGELEISTFLVQPGRQPISVFLDNLMHYGRSAALARWSLIIVAAEAALAWGVLSIGMTECRRLNAAN